MPPRVPSPSDPARIVMKKTSVWRCWILVLAVVAAQAAQDAAGPAEDYQNIIDRIREIGLAGERGFDFLEKITSVGPRLTGSPQAAAAVELARGICAAALEAVGLLHNLGLRPRQTIRAVLFMDEEFGGTGGRGYAVSPQRRGEKHLIAAESDGGGFVPIGLAVGGREGRGLDRVSPYLGLLKPFGVSFFSPGGGGVDVAPLIKQGAVPAIVRVNAQAYFDVHHSALDVVSSVQPRELELQAIILAVIAYIMAQEGI